jgi:hypothetical protein
MLNNKSRMQMNKECLLKCLKVLLTIFCWMLLIESIHINKCSTTSHAYVHGLGIQPIPYNHIPLKFATLSNVWLNYCVHHGQSLEGL